MPPNHGKCTLQTSLPKSGYVGRLCTVWRLSHIFSTKIEHALLANSFSMDFDQDYGVVYLAPKDPFDSLT